MLASIFFFRTASRTTKGWSTRSEAQKASRATIPAAPPFISSIRSKLLHATSVGMRHFRHKKIASLHLSPLKRPRGTSAHTPRPQILVLVHPTKSSRGVCSFCKGVPLPQSLSLPLLVCGSRIGRDITNKKIILIHWHDRFLSARGHICFIASPNGFVNVSIADFGWCGTPTTSHQLVPNPCPCHVQIGQPHALPSIKAEAWRRCARGF